MAEHDGAQPWGSQGQSEAIPLETIQQAREVEEPPLDYDNDLEEEVRVEVAGMTPRSEVSSDLEVTNQLLRRLPSRRLRSDDSANVITRTKSMRSAHRKSQKKVAAAGFLTLRLRDPEALMNNQDFVDAPTEIQAHNIRDVNASLHRKKEFLEKTRQTQKRKSRKIGCCKRTGWSLSLAWTHFKQQFAELRYSLELWGSDLKTIEGHFGSGVASYFIFLKGLFYLNILVFILTFAFVTIPQILYRYLQQEPRGYTQNSTFTGRELLTGGGWFQDTELYYGYHVNEKIEIIPGIKYDMRYAYILTCGGYYLLTVIILAILLSRHYRKHYIEESGATQSVSVSKVFCAWDYKITAEKTANLKHNSLFKDLQEFLAEFSKEDERRNIGQLTGIILLRILINILILGLLTGAGYLVWYISTTQSLNNDLDILKELAMPLCISAVNFILPFAFSILGSFEKYKNPRVELMLTMLRTIALNFVTLGVLLYFWYNSLECHAQNTGATRWRDGQDCKPCWENFMGEQIYQLVIMDFIFLLIITFFSEFIRSRAILWICAHYVSAAAEIFLSWLYRLGTFYSPLLSVLNIIKLFIIFYVKRVSVIQNCVPSARPWRAGQTSTFILLLLFGAFVACFIAVAYGVVFLRPSEVCGPFQSYNSSYAVITDLLDSWEASSGGDVVKSIIEIITSVGFLAFILIGMAVAAYYCKVVAQAHNEMVNRLRNQISLEGRDKKFLLQLLQQAMGQGVSSESTQTRTSQPYGRKPGSRPSQTSRGPTSRKAARRRSSANTPSMAPPISETVNQGYLDRSLSDRESTLPSMNPAYKERSPRQAESHLEAQNPYYREQSPNRRPDLPYPTQMYATTH